MLNDIHHSFTAHNALHQQWEIKYCQHSIEFARLSNPIEFDHRFDSFFVMGMLCVCVWMCMFGFRARIYISI